MIILSFLGLNGLLLFDWDEINFAESGREMIESGNFLQPTINFQAFHEKPPLFIWLQVGSFKVWGVGSLGARFPNVICGVLTALVLFLLGERRKEISGVWWAAFLGLSVLPLLYFRSGIIDPWFNLFILLGLWPALSGRKTWRAMLWGGLFLGLAVLTKGPAAGLIAGLCWLCLLWFRPEDRGGRMLKYGVTGLLALVPISIWLYFLWQTDDGFFAREFLTYQWRLFSKEDAGHGGFPGYHVVVLIFGCFPAGIFALPALLRRNRFNLPLDSGMRILFWVVLILFSIVNTKIIHYSSLAYFPLAYFAARGVTAGYTSKDWPWVKNGSVLIWFLYGILALALAFVMKMEVLERIAVDNPELFSRLQMPVTWPWWTLLPGTAVCAAAILLVYFRRQKTWRLALGQLALSAFFVTTASWVFAPRIQQYSQGALVEFYQGQAGTDVFYGTAYHKSYAHWFYGEVRPEVYDQGCRERQCRFHETITKSLFFSSPLRKTEQVLREVPDAKLLYQKGGYSFYERPPKVTE